MLLLKELRNRRCFLIFGKIKTESRQKFSVVNAIPAFKKVSTSFSNAKTIIFGDTKSIKMGEQVTRTFDILEYYLKEFPRPDALGGKKDGNWYTYSTEEYNRNSHLFAMGLMALGFKKGDKIATVTNNRPEWNFADMGMAMIGVFMYPFILPLEKTNINTF